MPSFRKTGTTIVGVTTRDCVILAADTRATSDTIVMEKNCQKIHYIGRYMQYAYYIMSLNLNVFINFLLLVAVVLEQQQILIKLRVWFLPMLLCKRLSSLMRWYQLHLLQDHFDNIFLNTW